MDNFADRLMHAIQAKNSRVCLGLDPRPDLLPPPLLPESGTEDHFSVQAVEATIRFCHDIIRAVAPYTVACKLNAAFFEQLHVAGVLCMYALAEVARNHGLLTIADVKRNDIGSTAAAYAKAYLSGKQARRSFDAVTVNGYFGSDGIQPFIEAARQGGQGVFVVVHSSNPSAAELQELELADGRRVYEAMADLVAEWGKRAIGQSGYSAVGAVCAATYPQQLAALRQRLPQQPFLVPGYGAQGAGPQDVVAAFDANGLGAIVNASRSILYAYSQPGYEDFGPERYAEAAAEAARRMRDAINEALAAAGKLGGR